MYMLNTIIIIGVHTENIWEKIVKRKLMIVNDFGSFGY